MAVFGSFAVTKNGSYFVLEILLVFLREFDWAKAVPDLGCFEICVDVTGQNLEKCRNLILPLHLFFFHEIFLHFLVDLALFNESPGKCDLKHDYNREPQQNIEMYAVTA